MAAEIAFSEKPQASPVPRDQLASCHRWPAKQGQTQRQRHRTAAPGASAGPERRLQTYGLPRRSFAVALEWNNLRHHPYAVQLLDNFFLLPVPHLRLELHDGARPHHRNAEMLRLNLQFGQHSLHFAGYALRMSGGNPESHDRWLQIGPSRDPAQHDQAEQNQPRRKSCHRVESTAYCHADGRFGEDGRSGCEPNQASRFAQNRARTQKSNALHEIGSDARGGSVAKETRQLERQNREERRAHAHKRAGANSRPAAMNVALDADRRSQERRKTL